MKRQLSPFFIGFCFQTKGQLRQNSLGFEKHDFKGYLILSITYLNTKLKSLIVQKLYLICHLFSLLSFMSGSSKGPLKTLTMSEACQILDLSDEQGKSYGHVRVAYRDKIRIVTQNRTKRIEVNLAYQFFNKIHFKNEEPEEQLINFIMLGQTVKVMNKIKRKPSRLNYRTVGGNFPMVYLAVRSGFYDIVQFFLKSGCQLNFENDQSTPMHCAAYYGHYTIIPLLLKYKISVTIKNKFGNLPLGEAATPEIKRLLQNANKDSIYGLEIDLNQSALSLGTINIQEKGVVVIKKIIMKNMAQKFSDHTDAFHGTNFHSLFSIAKHGLKRSGSVAGSEMIVPVAGHIKRGLTINGIKNWSDAIFVSPSIYYAGHPVYAKVHINNENQRWLPVVQVKVKNGTFTRHDHTFGNNNYKLLDNEPTSLQFRIQVKDSDHKDLIMRNTNNEDVEIVALILIKEGYLDNHEDYYKTTELLLNSAEEKTFRKKY